MCRCSFRNSYVTCNHWYLKGASWYFRVWIMAQPCFHPSFNLHIECIYIYIYSVVPIFWDQSWIASQKEARPQILRTEHLHRNVSYKQDTFEDVFVFCLSARELFYWRIPDENLNFSKWWNANHQGFLQTIFFGISVEVTSVEPPSNSGPFRNPRWITHKVYLQHYHPNWRYRCDLPIYMYKPFYVYLIWYMHIHSLYTWIFYCNIM